MKIGDFIFSDKITEDDILLINELTEKIKFLEIKSIEEMTDNEFIKYCQHKHLKDDEIKIADLFLRQNLKGKEFYNAIGYSESQAKRKRKQILQKINKIE